jgi:uncharacterized protein with beta-barrel porin domain
MVLPDLSGDKISSNNVAPAAGSEDVADLDAKNGLWISGFAGNSKNKQHLTTKTNFGGSSIGYERFLDTGKAVGFALTLLRTNSKSGTNTKINSNNFIASVYGVSNINNVILSGAVFAGQGDSKTQRYITANGQNLSSKGKFKSKFYGAQSSLGYQIHKQQHVFTPAIGLQYSANAQDKYRETGIESISRDIGKRNSQLLIGTLSARYSYVITKGDTLIVPSLQIGAAKDLTMKASNIQSKFVWQDSAYNFKVENKKQLRLFTSPTLSIQNDMTDLVLSYAFDKAKKTTGHMMSIKVMTKF